MDTTSQQDLLLKTIDGKTFTRASPNLPVGELITAVSIQSGTDAQKRYYVATRDATSTTATAKVYVSPDSGASWPAPVPVGVNWVSGLAISPSDPSHAWLGAADGTFLETHDGGATWQPLTVTGQSLPSSLAPIGTAVSASGNGQLFVATDIGVFSGALDGNGHVTWIPYDDGLPDGVDVNDIHLNSQTLIIGTFGYGAFRRSISETTCPNVRLLVRDNVFDQGQAPNTQAIPDPEWPIPDPASPPFFKPNDGPDGLVYPWESTDIRTDVPSVRDVTPHLCPAQLGQVCTLDTVDFETMPLQVGIMWATTNPNAVRAQDFLDISPRRGQLANVYVQVTNDGIAQANNVRVVSLYANASAGVPTLPSTFWGTFPPGGACPPNLAANADLGNGWQLAGCTMVAAIRPGVPEIAKFPWPVPTATADHSCMVAIVDSADDEVDPSVSPTDVEILARTERHVAQRNLHVLDNPAPPPATAPPAQDGIATPGLPFSGLTTLKVPNRWNSSGMHKIMFSTSGMEKTGRLAFLLPTGKTAPGLPPACGVTGNTSGNVAISIPRAIVPTAVSLSANGTVDIGDRVVVQNEVGGGGPVVNAGSGTTTVGANANVGAISAIGGVFLRSNSTVTGDVNSGGTLTEQTGVSIKGTTNQTTTLSPVDVVSWGVVWPAVSGGNLDIQPGQPVTEAPGRFGNVSVKGGATLKLTSGIYYLDSLTMESQSTLSLDQAAGPTTVYTRQGVTFRGANRTVSGAAPDLLLVAIGPNDVIVETSFTGTIVAPAARMTLGGGGGTFTGSYYAHDLVVRADVKILQRPTMAWSGLPICRALTGAEQSIATAAGLSTTLYPVIGVGPKQQIPIPFGQTWTIGVRYDSGIGHTRTASRFRVMSLDPNDVVVAGSTYLLRQWAAHWEADGDYKYAQKGEIFRHSGLEFQDCERRNDGNTSNQESEWNA
jgi:hypothetical protein